MPALGTRGAASARGFGFGAAGRAQLAVVYSSNTANASLNVTSISGYKAGKSDITITVNAGVYLYATTTGNYGLSLSGGATGDTVTLVNNGFIMGCGGDGGRSWTSGGATNGAAGGPALNLGFATTINNTNASAYIGGGGGGAGGSGNTYGGGGGGAGGGTGGNGGYSGLSPAGGAGGGVGSSGSNGGVSSTVIKGTTYYYGGAGGGGRVFPGTGGSGGVAQSGSNVNGKGGGSGGGGGYQIYTFGTAGAGGSANSNGASGTGATYGFEAGGGGGGGWGASGGNSYQTSGAGGGKAVNLNGNSVTWTSGNTTRVYGSVS